MRKHLSEILLTLLVAALLVGFAFAVPHPAITDDALEAYMNDGAAADDDYDFLFERPKGRCPLTPQGTSSLAPFARLSW